MSDILCITNRHLCTGDFLRRIEQIAACHPAGIVLREKDLSPTEYRALACEVLDIGRTYHTRVILHRFADVARELSAPALHLPLPVLRELSAGERAAFSTLGASCHSVEDAREAATLGCTYITAGHVFATDCKPGLPGRGLPFLREVTAAVSLPVYAIGGISPETAPPSRTAGAAGVCVMSGAMQCDDVRAYFDKLEGASICAFRQTGCFCTP